MKGSSFFIIFILCLCINSYGLSSLLFQEDTCSVFILQNDTIIISNNPVQIQLNSNLGADYYIWNPSTGLSNDTIPNPIATVNGSFQYTVEAFYLIDSNLIFNGDFELGVNGFTTQYNYEINPNPAFGPGDYNVVANTNEAGSGFLSCQNGGLFLIADASLIPNTILYQINVNIEPNTYYLFSTESTNFLSFNNNDLPIIEYKINNQVLRLDTIRSVNCNWQKYSDIWYNNNSSTVSITIKDLNTTQMGNDFAIDNISLKKLCIATDTINILFASHPITDTIDVTICENKLPYIYFDSVFSKSGVYFYNFSTNNIIDSSYIINLIVNKTYYDTITAEICYGETYNQFGFNENNTGIYSISYQSINGCDSILILNLQVCRVFFPNVVTPNDDNINDVFVINNLLEQNIFPENEIFIYNRQGKMIYYFKNIKKKEDFWSPKQTNSPNGTYYYRFIGKRPNKTIDKTGAIEVLK